MKRPWGSFESRLSTCLKGTPHPAHEDSGGGSDSLREENGRSVFVAALACLVSFSLASCVTARDGSKKFDPWKAAVRTDDQIGDWMENMGYPVEHTVKADR